MELYLYFHFGSVFVGGCDSPYFLETTAAIQEAVKVADLVNREQLCKRNDDVEQQAKGKKGKALLINNINEMEDYDPTSSFGAAYEKQVEIESVCVETELSREERERRRDLIQMLEVLIASDSTPEEKSEYKTELVCLMLQTVQEANLKSMVSSSVSDVASSDSVSFSSSSS